MAKYIELLENLKMENTLENPQLTKFLFENRALIDPKLPLSSDEDIMGVFGLLGVFGKEVIVLTDKYLYYLKGRKFDLKKKVDIAGENVFIEQVPAHPYQGQVLVKVKNPQLVYGGFTAYLKKGFLSANTENDTVEPSSTPAKFVATNVTPGNYLSKMEHPPVLHSLKADKHIDYLSTFLDDGEVILFMFTGPLKNFESNVTAFAITSKNYLLLASKGIYGFRHYHKRIRLTDIKEISIDFKALTNILSIETLTENLLITAGADKLKIISNIIRSYVDKLITQPESKTNTVTPLSDADELRKWKKLLDDEIISAEEFEQKKKEILGF